MSPDGLAGREYSLAEALELAKQAAPITELPLKGRVEKLPEEFWRLNRLEILDLESSGLTELSPGIAGLTDLKELYLSENHLTDLPPEIGRLESLERLSLRGIS